MRARWIGTDVAESELLTQRGDVALGAGNYHFHILVRCPVCDDLHIVDPKRWVWDQETLTIAPSVLVGPYTRGPNNQPRRCHWWLTNGEFRIEPDSILIPEA